MSTTTVTAKYLDPSGAACKGRVVFRLVAATYQDGLDAIFPTVPIHATLNASGQITVELEPTSGTDAAFDADDMTYQVWERINGTDRAPYYVDVPTAASVDLGTLATYDDPPAFARQYVIPDLTNLGYALTEDTDADYVHVGRAGRAEVQDEMSAHASGSLDGVAPSYGPAWNTTGAAAPTVTSGKLYSSAEQGYAVQTLASNNHQVLMCEVTFYGSDNTQTTMTMASSGTAGTVDDLVHCNFGPLGYQFTIRRDAGSFDLLGDGRWEQPCLMDDTTKYRFVMMVSDDTLTFIGPNGETYSWTDPRIGDARGTEVYWQPTTLSGNIAKLTACAAWSGATTGLFGLADIFPGDHRVLNYRRTAGSRGSGAEVSIGREPTNNMPGVMFGGTIYTTITTAVAITDTTLNVGARIPAGSAIQIDSGDDSETLTASGAIAGGTGPYTRVVTTGATKVHPVGTAVIATPTASHLTYMFYNNESNFFYLPNLTVLAAPGGWLYFGSALDTALERKAANTLGMASGDSFQVDGTYNGGKLKLGGYYLWVDAEARLRIHTSAPSADHDGVVVGSQS